MTYARRHRALLAWMLYAFILFNGFVCSIGHGQMLGDFSSAATLHSMDCTAAFPSLGSLDDLAVTEPGPQLKLVADDCAFASSLILYCVFFLVLGWLLARSRESSFVPWLCSKASPRHSSPGLAPQAP